MHIQPVLTAMQMALANDAALAGDDPAVEAAVAHLTEALGPALRQAALELAEQAAGEVTAQLSDRTVDVVLVDGDPALRVTEARPDDEDPASSEDLDARITLRVPPTLKRLIEDAAETTGASVNAWVVDALAKRTRRANNAAGHRVHQTFDL
jgi:HicB family